jgi:2,4-dienoyl-CoA reductase [(3E)-enoyl-CoA-producing], peroxisomal
MESVFKDNFLSGKVAVITGGHGGMLYETAKTYLKYGASVAIMARKEDKINEAVTNLKKESGSDKIIGVKCDVRVPKVIEEAVDKVLSTFKRIDILINGAAGNFLAGVDNLSYNAYKTVIEIDLIGTFNVTKVVWTKWMKEHGGSIINFSAGLYQNGTMLQSHAGSAKAGVDALTKHFCNEFVRRVYYNKFLGPQGSKSQ